MFWAKYPYTDAHELNLDWVLRMIKKMDKSLSEFEALNKITFSGEWDITKQYPAWTIVNTNGGRDGYISIKPVPAGVTIDNTDYWRAVANYSDLIADLQNRVITLESEVDNIYVTLEDFGAAGDGVTDDTQALVDALASGKNIRLGDGKSYGISGRNVLTLSNQTIYSDGSGKFINLDDPNTGAATESSWILFEGDNITLDGVTFDCGGTWVARPLVESGSAWTDYLAQRANTLKNVRFRNSTNVTIRNCTFTGGKTGLSISDASSRVMIKNCDINHTLADGLYIDNGSNAVKVSGCTVSYIDDDSFCVNLNDNAYVAPFDVIVEACSGEELYGAIGCSDGGNNVTFIGCHGKVHRTVGMRAVHSAEATYGENAKGITFINCSMEVYSDYNVGGAAVAGTEQKDYTKFMFIGCTFDMSGKTAASINSTPFLVNGFNATFQGCNFRNVFIDGRPGTTAKNIAFRDCNISMICNAFLASVDGVTFEGCKITNEGLIDDVKLTGAGTADTVRRCAFDLLNAKNVKLLNNTYVYTGTDSRPFSHVAFDDYSSSATLECDTDYIRTNNEQTGNELYYTKGVVLHDHMSLYSPTSAGAVMGAGSLRYNGAQLVLSIDGATSKSVTLS